MNIKKKNEIKAKHVLGELTLGDVLPLVENKCGSVTLDDGDLEESDWIYMVFAEGGLELWRDWDDDGPEHKFPASLKVKWRDDHIEMPESGYVIYFNEHKPIKIKIL